MQTSRNQHREKTIFSNALSELVAGLPMAMIVLGVFANFAWVIGLFWLLSYWIVWR